MAWIISRGRDLAVVAAGLVLVSACGGSSPAPTPTPASDVVQDAATPAPAAAELRIVVLGDSIAAGLGLAEADAFPAVVEERLHDAGFPVEVVNAGVSGDTSAGGLRRIDWILRQEPEVVVVELGANDALRGQPLDSTEDNLRQIITRCRAAGAQVVLTGMDVPTNYGPDYAGGFAAMYERIAADEGVVLVPAFVREVGLEPELMQPDGLHPTAEGQRRLADQLVPVLERILRSPR
jgi:acyl-CoA thioesterase-1